jgi:hypothetical protein
MRHRLAGALTAIAFIALIAGSLAIVILTANRASFLSPPTHNNFFPSWMAGPLGGLWPGMTNKGLHYKNVFSYSMFGMFFAYLVALRFAPRVHIRWTIAAVVLVHVVFLLSPPTSLTDVFNYLNYARMEVVHHLNPYTTIPMVEPHLDPTFDISNWHQLLSPYGPLFTVFTFALALLSVPVAFWTLKVLLMLVSLGVIYLVWRCARLLGRDPTLAVVLVALNPVVLVWGLGGDHNDFFTLLFIMICVYLLLRDRDPRDAVAGVFARARRLLTIRRASVPLGSDQATLGAKPGLKQPTATLLRLWPQQSECAQATGAPLAAANGNGATHAIPYKRFGRGAHLSWRALGAGVAIAAAVAIKASSGVLLPVVVLGARRRVGVLLGVVLAGAALAVMTLVAFGPHLPDLTTQDTVVTNMSLPNLLGLAIGVGGETSGVRLGADALLVCIALACAIWAWRSRIVIGPAAVATIGLLVTLGWVLPWYVLWLLPLAALTRWRSIRAFALIYSAYLIFAWFPLQSNFFKLIGFSPNSSTLAQVHSNQSNFLLH